MSFPKCWPRLELAAPAKNQAGRRRCCHETETSHPLDCRRDCPADVSSGSRTLELDRTPLGAMLAYLPFGWLLFLQRNIPQITFNWRLVTTYVILSALVLVLGNWFMSVLYEQIQVRSQPGNPARKWRWRWTAGLYASIWLLFLVAFGSAGVLRHTTWLVNYDQPWYERRGGSFWVLMDASDKMLEVVTDNDQDLEKTRNAVMAVPGYLGGTHPLCEDFNVILYGDSSNNVAAYLIIPRDPKLLATGVFAACLPDGTAHLSKPLSELPQLVSEMDAKYPIKTSQ